MFRSVLRLFGTACANPRGSVSVIGALAEVAELHQLEQNVCNRTDEHDDQHDALFWLQCPAQAHNPEDCQNQNGKDYDHSPNCIPESDRTARTRSTLPAYLPRLLVGTQP